MPKGFDAVEPMMARTDRTRGFSVRFDYSSGAVTETDSAPARSVRCWFAAI
jgi:hypothetical protein